MMSPSLVPARRRAPCRWRRSSRAEIPMVVIISGTWCDRRSPYYVAPVSSSASDPASSPIGRSRTAAAKPFRVVRLGARRRSRQGVRAAFHPRRRPNSRDVESAAGQCDFAPFLQRARDLAPDTLFVFVPAGQAGTFARHFAERGLDKSGIKFVGPGDIVDDNDLAGPATPCSVSSPPASIRRRIRPRSTRPTSRLTPRPPAQARQLLSVGGYDGWA